MSQQGFTEIGTVRQNAMAIWHMVAIVVLRLNERGGNINWILHSVCLINSNSKKVNFSLCVLKVCELMLNNCIFYQCFGKS